MSDKSSGSGRVIGDKFGGKRSYQKGDTQCYLLPTATVESKTKVLLGRKKEVMEFVGGSYESVKVYNYPGSWVIIGGAGDVGETAEDACYREFWEETGIARTKLELLGGSTKFIDMGAFSYCCLITTTTNPSDLLEQIKSNLTKGPPTRQDDELAEVAWVSVSEATDLFKGSKFDLGWFVDILKDIE